MAARTSAMSTRITSAPPITALPLVGMVWNSMFPLVRPRIG
jgi:hypothetical protein